MRGPSCAVVVLTAVVSLAAAGCSGADADGSDSTTTTVASTTAATVDATTTTTVATTSTTSPPTTANPVTTSSTSTTITTTPGPSLEELEAEVAAAYDTVYEGYWACLRAPLACDTSWLLEGSGSAEAMQNTMQALADRDRYVGDDPVGYYVIESIEFNADFTEATVTSCWSLTAVLYSTPIDPNRPPGPDNPPTIVNDTPGSVRQVDVMTQRADGAWPVRSSRGLEEASREDLCAD